jgi:hypothetical protein
MNRAAHSRIERADAVAFFRLARRVGSAGEHMADRLLVIADGMLEGANDDRVFREFRELGKRAAETQAGECRSEIAGDRSRLFGAIEIRIECLDVARPAAEKDHHHGAILNPRGVASLFRGEDLRQAETAEQAEAANAKKIAARSPLAMASRSMIAEREHGSNSETPMKGFGTDPRYQVFVAEDCYFRQFVVRSRRACARIEFLFEKNHLAERDEYIRDRERAVLFVLISLREMISSRGVTGPHSADSRRRRGFWMDADPLGREVGVVEEDPRFFRHAFLA